METELIPEINHGDLKPPNGEGNGSRKEDVKKREKEWESKREQESKRAEHQYSAHVPSVRVTTVIDPLFTYCTTATSVK